MVVPHIDLGALERDGAVVNNRAQVGDAVLDVAALGLLVAGGLAALGEDVWCGGGIRGVGGGREGGWLGVRK